MVAWHVAALARAPKRRKSKTGENNRTPCAHCSRTPRRLHRRCLRRCPSADGAAAAALWRACTRARHVAHHVARPLPGHAASAEREPPVPPCRAPVARVSRAHRRRACLARAVGARPVVDQAGGAPSLAQLHLGRPQVEGVLGVEVALRLRPRGALPVVPLTLDLPLGGRAEAIQADAAAHAQRECDGEEAGRGRALARGPPEQAPQLAVEARVDLVRVRVKAGARARARARARAKGKGGGARPSWPSLRRRLRRPGAGTRRSTACGTRRAAARGGRATP